jgi:arylformamidase
MDRAALDALYNNRAAVPTHQEDFARWAQATAKARAELSARLNLPYGDHARERLDLFFVPWRLLAGIEQG